MGTDKCTMSCGHHCSTTENNYTLLSFTPSLILFPSLCRSEFLTAIILLLEEFLLTCLEEQIQGWGFFLAPYLEKVVGFLRVKHTHTHVVALYDCGPNYYLLSK